MDSFWEKRKKSKNGCFFGHFWANFGYVSHIPAIRFWCLCTRRGPFGCRMTVQNFVKIVWTVFEKFEIFMKRSGEKKQKKQHDCISSRKFFPTPNKINFVIRGKWPKRDWHSLIKTSNSNTSISKLMLETLSERSFIWKEFYLLANPYSCSQDRPIGP